MAISAIVSLLRAIYVRVAMNVSRFSTTPSTLSLFLRLLCRHVLGNSGSKVPPFLHKTRIIATKQVLVGTLGNEMIANRILTDNTLSRTYCDFNLLLSVFQDAYTIFKRIHLELEFLITLNTHCKGVVRRTC